MRRVLVLFFLLASCNDAAVGITEPVTTTTRPPTTTTPAPAATSTTKIAVLESAIRPPTDDELAWYFLQSTLALTSTDFSIGNFEADSYGADARRRSERCLRCHRGRKRPSRDNEVCHLGFTTGDP